MVKSIICHIFKLFPGLSYPFLTIAIWLSPKDIVSLTAHLNCGCFLSQTPWATDFQPLYSLLPKNPQLWIACPHPVIPPLTHLVEVVPKPLVTLLHLLLNRTWVYMQQSQSTYTRLWWRKEQHSLQGTKQEEQAACAPKTWIPWWLSGKCF